MGRARLLFTLMEFALPLVAAVLFLKLVTRTLSPDYAGLVVLINTASLLLVNMEPMGGRAYSGYIASLAFRGRIKLLLFAGLIVSVLVGVGELLAVFLSLAIYFSGELTSFDSAYYVFGGFVFISFFGVLNAYFSTIRLGLGDINKRSKILIFGHIVSLLLLVLVFVGGCSNPVELVIPFAAREVFVFFVNLIWMRRTNNFNYKFSIDSLRPYWRTAIKSSFLSISVAFFEPILKLLVANTQGLSNVPSFELFLRLVAAARNAITVFLQNFVKILAINNSSINSIRTIGKVYLPILFLCMTGSLLGALFFGDLIVPGASHGVVLIYVNLLPSIFFYLFSQIFYFKLMYSGHVGKLLWLHVGMGAGAVFSFLFKNYIDDYLVFISFLYLIGGIGAIVLWGLVYSVLSKRNSLLVVIVSIFLVNAAPYIVSLSQVYFNFLNSTLLLVFVSLVSIVFVFKGVDLLKSAEHKESV